ncbi:glutathione S-transferase T3-like [Brassica napus]|uniref:glutathione S-transferase T3-like n=1 Tax=Brassica napus TaxID=3708 RepID=UPI00207A5BC8|nr:glutathione S-transferase T3-like [Brassica napus]
MVKSGGYVNLVMSQGPVHLDSCDPLLFTGQSSGVSTVKERRKWSLKEDLILIGAWLNTSKDPIVSNEQKQRWARINEGVCKFAGCYDMALREQRSGQNENDVMKSALDIFANDQGSKFNFEHAWRELRHDVKWCSTYLEKDKRKPADSQGDGEGAVPEPEPEPEERPIGVEAAKAGSKRKKTGKEEELAKLENLLELRKKISQQSLLESLLTKPKPLSEMESALKSEVLDHVTG